MSTNSRDEEGRVRVQARRQTEITGYIRYYNYIFILLSFRFNYICQATHWIITPSQLNFVLFITAGLREKNCPNQRGCQNYLRLKLLMRSKLLFTSRTCSISSQGQLLTISTVAALFIALACSSEIFSEIDKIIHRDYSN